jgi:glutamate-1-semialdehyde 2,1-aminomutase
MGMVVPDLDFLKGLRNLCDVHGSLLVFDEVMTGFRVDYGGAQEIFGIIPDMTIFGKVIGGGLPVGAYGGKFEIMDYLAPNGPVYQAGTLSGNPLAMSAGLSVLNRLNKKLYGKLENITKKIEKGFLKNIKETKSKAIVNRAGSMMTLFFTDQEKIETYNDAVRCNLDQYAKYFKNMLDMGIYLPPSQYECMFISSAYSEDDIKKIIDCNKKSLELL